MLKLLSGISHFPLMQQAEGEGGAGAGSGGGDAGAQSGDSGGADKGAADGGKANDGKDSGGDSDSLLDGLGDDGGDAGAKALDFSKGKPEGFPDELWDADKNQPKADLLYQKMQDAEARAKGLRDKLAKGEGKPPKDAKEYTVDAGEKGKALVKDDDPLLAEAQKIAHELKIPKETYGKFMGKLTDFLADHIEKLQENPPELTPEQKAEIRQKEYAKIGTNAPQIIKAVETWGRELKAQGQFSEDDLAAFKSMALTGEQVRVLNKLRALAGGGKSLPMDFSGDGLPSDSEISDMIVKAHKSGDAAEAAKVEEILNKRRQAGRPERLQI